MGSLHSATLSKAKMAIRIRQSQRWVLGLGEANVAPPQSGGERSLSYILKEDGLLTLHDYPISCKQQPLAASKS